MSLKLARSPELGTPACTNIPNRTRPHGEDARQGDARAAAHCRMPTPTHMRWAGQRRNGVWPCGILPFREAIILRKLWGYGIMPTSPVVLDGSPRFYFSLFSP